MTKNHGTLCDYHTGAAMRPATAEHLEASREAARWDGGVGVILVDEAWQLVAADEPGAAEATRCYVQE